MKYKKYAVYHGDRYVETYKDLKKAQAHIQQEKNMGTTGWRIIESEYPYTMSQESVANLISLVATTVDRIHRGNFDAVTDMIEHIKDNMGRYGNPCEDLMDHLFDTLNPIRCIVECNELQNQGKEIWAVYSESWPSKEIVFQRTVVLFWIVLIQIFRSVKQSILIESSRLVLNSTGSLIVKHLKQQLSYYEKCN